MCSVKTVSLPLVERVFSHLRVAASAQKGKMAGIYKLEQRTAGQRVFRKLIQGFDLPMKTGTWRSFHCFFPRTFCMILVSFAEKGRKTVAASWKM